MRKHSLHAQQSGAVIASILIISVFLGTFIYGLMTLANSNLVRARTRLFVLQAQYAAESGVDHAIAILNSGDEFYNGTTSDVALMSASSYRATYAVGVVPGTNARQKIVTAEGKVYFPKSASTPSYTRKIEVTVERSTTTTSSSIISRNIVDIESGVKNIEGVDIYVNGYIRMNRNTTNLIAENITVVDKNTGALNCSIDGTGNLIKPATFTNPGQTKTNITLGFNNCVDPPGNSTNADFNVSANNAGLGKIQSTFIPVSQYMDSSYQNAPGGCSDWTTGSSPRSIPSTGNTKKTHYPDSGSNVSSSCGSSGDIQLGSNTYEIKDHAHVRASFCAATACTPTFYNPDSGAAGIKFIFVEGTINFDNLITSPGSGPIVFIAYGGDPPSKASVCPLGGSIYLGKTDTASASAAFLLANNGVCLDKTKFGTSPALGGISGKNIFVSTSPGTPFDLKLDPAFPVSAIPVDLAWRAVRFRRL